MKLLVRILIAVLIAAWVPALFWLAGLNFDHRGDDTAYIALMTLVVFFGVIFFPE